METAMVTIYSGMVLLLMTFITLRLLWRPGSKKLPPGGPLALPIIGHLHLLSQPLHHTLTAISSRYGPLLLLRFGYRPVLLVASPSAAEDCLTAKNDIVFANRPFLLAGEILGRNHTDLVSAPYGPHWRNMRRIAAHHIFSPAGIAALSALRAAEVHSLTRQLFRRGDSGGGFSTVEMKSKLTELTFNTLIEMTVGKWEGAAEEGRRFRALIGEWLYLMGAVNLEDYIPFITFMKWVGMRGTEKRMLRLRDELELLLQRIVDARRTRRRRQMLLGEEEEDKIVIDVMLPLQEKEPEYYTDDILKGFIQVFIIGGTDTSAGTMEWALSLLLNNPELLSQARDEIDKQVGHKQLVTDSDLSNLPYLHNVIKETLRLFPAGPLLLPHHASEECNVGGYNIPRGTMLLVNAYAIHRDPNLWEDPLKFKPERFEAGDGEGYKYIPFSTGRRKCPGEVMAVKFMALALGTFIQCFEWKRVGEAEVDLAEGPGLSMPKAIPLEALFKPRESMIHILSQL